MIIKRDFSKTIITLFSLFMLVLVGSGTVLAVARGYSSDDQGLKPGMVVSLSNTSTAATQKVQRASLEDIDSIIGITVVPDQSDVTIASGDQKVFVESTGEANVYVSDLDGVVNKGDLLTLSPLKGILTKGHSGSRMIVGIALEDFAKKTAQDYTIDGSNGPQVVKIDQILVNLDRQRGSAQLADKSDSSLERLGKSVAGKHVGESRVVVALIVFLIVLAAEGGIIYGAVSSSITSLGRNPMARSIINRELIRVILIAGMVLLFGLIVIYGILWV